MRTHRWIPAIVLATALAACSDDVAPGSKAQGGDEDNQGAGYAQEQGQGTVLNDTTPHRPGAPEKP